MRTESNRDYMTIEVWHECPQDCRFCSSQVVHKDERLDLKTVISFIEKYKPKSIRWSGGEPSCFPDFLYFSKNIRRCYPEIYQIINTCGRFNFESMNEFVFDKIDCIRFSLVGNKWYHNYFTNGDNYGTLVNNLTKCVAQLHDVDVQLTTPFITVESLDEVLDTAMALDIRVRVSMLVDKWEFDYRDLPSKPIERYLDYKKNLFEEKLDLLMDNCSINPNKPCKKDDKIGILPDGSTYECAVEKLGGCLRKCIEDGD